MSEIGRENRRRVVAETQSVGGLLLRRVAMKATTSNSEGPRVICTWLLTLNVSRVADSCGSLAVAEIGGRCIRENRTNATYSSAVRRKLSAMARPAARRNLGHDRACPRRSTASGYVGLRCSHASFMKNVDFCGTSRERCEPLALRA